MTTSPTKMPRPLPLTLIVATTPTLGIGLRGALPWRIKSEMQYFARVTQRVPQNTSTTKEAVDDGKTQQQKQKQNAVIMGRKTWESIPPKFRPLRNRVNVVLSRDRLWLTEHASEGFLGAGGLGEAVELLRKSSPSSSSASSTSQSREGGEVEPRAFVIGGAEVYRAALEREETDAVLVTRVFGEWECDAFFPVDLDEEVNWRRASVGELREYTGEEGISEEPVKEGDVEFEYRLYRRKT